MHLQWNLTARLATMYPQQPHSCLPNFLGEIYFKERALISYPLKWWSDTTGKHTLAASVSLQKRCLAVQSCVIPVWVSVLSPRPTLSRDASVQINRKIQKQLLLEGNDFVALFLKIFRFIGVTHCALLFWCLFLAGIKHKGWIHSFQNSDKWLIHTMHIKILYTYLKAAQLYCVKKKMKISILTNN